MKIRSTFVTNSSSSSFVCEICGRVESGWDIGLSEAEMMECVNGHIFCCDEALEKPSKKELIQIILENEWNNRYNYKTDCCEEITEEELFDMDEDELFDDFCSDDGYDGVPERMCPFCQFIEYSEYDLSRYLQKEYNESRDEVFAKVKQLNKRRKKLYENEYITHVCSKYGLNPAGIVASWKEKFGTYSNFNKWLRE